MRPQPLIAVSDVEASSRWYRQLLGCTSGHGGRTYERLQYNGELVMQLHSFDSDHDHGRIGDPEDKPYGNGVLLWFEVADFDAVLTRASAMDVEIVMPRRRNPPDGVGGPNQWECWIRDPDGYAVVMAESNGNGGRQLEAVTATPAMANARLSVNFASVRVQPASRRSRLHTESGGISPNAVTGEW